MKLLSASGWTAVVVTYHEPGTKKQPQRGGKVWEGSWVDEVYDLAGTFRLDVRRTSSTMTGSLEVSGSPCLSAGELRAEVLGDQVEFGLVVGGVDQVTFSGVIEGNRVAGTFTSGPGCGTGSGPGRASSPQRVAERATGQRSARAAMLSRRVWSMPASYADTRLAIDSGLSRSTTPWMVSGDAPDSW